MVARPVQLSTPNAHAALPATLAVCAPALPCVRVERLVGRALHLRAGAADDGRSRPGRLLACEVPTVAPPSVPTAVRLSLPDASERAPALRRRIGHRAVVAVVAGGGRGDVAVVLAPDGRVVDRGRVVAALLLAHHVLHRGLVDLVGAGLELPGGVLADVVGERRRHGACKEDEPQRHTSRRVVAMTPGPEVAGGRKDAWHGCSFRKTCTS
jgi:hypothetical protein